MLSHNLRPTAAQPEQRSAPVDLRASLPPVRDQGPRGTCAAFAVTAAHEFLRGETAMPRDLAEEVLYWRCKQADGEAEPGTTFASASVAISTGGQPAEELWPYDPLRDDRTAAYTPPVGAVDPAACFRAVLEPIEPALDAIKRSLQQGQVLVLGLWLTDAFYNVINGEIRPPSEHDQLLDGHAVLVVGFREREVGEGAFVVRNSWGPAWGEGGYGYLPYSHLNLGVEAWIVGQQKG